VDVRNPCDVEKLSFRISAQQRLQTCDIHDHFESR
jgi:hypothetical protein